MENATYDRLRRRSRNRHDAYRKFLKSVRSPRRQRPSSQTTRCAAGHVCPDRAPVKLDWRQSCEIFPRAFGRRPNNNNNTTRSFMRLLLVPHAVVIEIFFQFGRYIMIIINTYFLHAHVTLAPGAACDVCVCVKRARDYCSTAAKLLR